MNINFHYVFTQQCPYCGEKNIKIREWKLTHGVRQFREQCASCRWTGNQSIKKVDAIKKNGSENFEQLENPHHHKEAQSTSLNITCATQMSFGNL